MLWTERQEIALLRSILEVEKEQLVQLKKLNKHKFHIYIIWKGPEEINIMSNDVQLNLTAPFGNNVGVPVETENGNPFVFTPTNIQWVVQDNTVVSFVPNPDGSATFTPLKVGSTQVAVGDTATGASKTGTITVVQVNNVFEMSINWTAPPTT